MHELLEIVRAMERLQVTGEQATVATIVGVHGSTYRREGARMLITAGGEFVGTISGGCLEADLYERSKDVLQEGRSLLRRYDTRAEDDMVWGLGLGCNGTVEVLLEPFVPDMLTTLKAAVERQQPTAVATVVAAPADGAVQVGNRMVVAPERQSTLGNDELDGKVIPDAQALLPSGIPRTLHYGAVSVFVDVLVAPPSLLVCGAGHDAIPVVRLARQLGWRVRVADSRAKFLTPERFPEADERLLVAPEEVAAQVPIDDRTYTVLMTHNYQHDLDILRGLLQTATRYIGILGPRKRTDKLLEDVSKDAELKDVARVCAPVGLDLGAETPEEIALSIVAEIQAVRTGARVQPLRQKQTPIHAR